MSQINQEIDARAADWAARLDRDPLSAQEQAALQAWLAADARHRGAFMRMRAIAFHTGRASALGRNFDPERFDAQLPVVRPRGSLRRWGWLGAAAAAALLVVAVSMQALKSGQSYDTRRGEIRVVTLADGSVMTLNTASRATVNFDDSVRRVRLAEGEALFEVTKDALRPFVVNAGDASVRAIGTAFTVSHLADAPIQVVVKEGVVEVRQPSLKTPLRVVANMRAVLPAPSALPTEQLSPIALSAEAVSRELAWRDGRIAFESETLAEAANAFARYSSTRIVIEDPAIARQEITGLFTANDPVSFARAAAESLDLQAEVRDGEVVITR